ncbi:transmembrane protein 42 isoform X1 [Rhynchophorus ferrugineus]|uniref:transmembrane protein 42 isoform X1 n=2 Tax=Rhynchophorus ferrugineus TaxID=354439 RepID=UPI003FCE603C
MKIQYAILSGCFGAVGGAFGKLCSSSNVQASLIINLLCILAMISCNTCCMTFFVKALHQSNSSLVATIISSSFNYSFSAVLGFLIFDEMTSLYWWSGFLFILIGLVLIVSEDNNKSKINYQCIDNRDVKRYGNQRSRPALLEISTNLLK